MDLGPTALLTDLYQLNMLTAYRDHGMTDIAVFELFVRKLPMRRGFLMAAGLEQALCHLETLAFSEADIARLRGFGGYSEPFLDYLSALRFTGDVDALPEGTVFFADEPVLRVVAPLPEAQLVETRLINLIHFETVIASKAARQVLAAQGKPLIDFGLRRAHGAEAGMLAARASYIAGFAGTATLAAGIEFGIPVKGTMAHSFIQAHDDEIEAFEHFARSRPRDLVLLIDTYDTERGAHRVAELAHRLAAEGIVVSGVRIDSGDLGEDARKVRGILDDAGLPDVTIVASGGLDEDELLALRNAPIDAFGVGTSLTTSSDAPALDCAYKLQEYAGTPRRKRSQGKATWPGRKQVWRSYAASGEFAGDRIMLADESGDGRALLRPAMRGGKRVAPAASIRQIRDYARDQLARLPAPFRRLEPSSYPVEISENLRNLASEFDRKESAASAPRR
ncbi:MAG TPA: nicotinate phosphoribosyltransferase [Stellaceae bacterium]|nr:nicotinate phosphoribosyltransferase [Stellaceae bacterium]